MPDDEEKQPAEAAEAEAPAENGEADEVDQDAMMAEWEAMAAEIDDDQEAASGDVPAADSGPAEKMPAIHEVSLEAYAILGTASMPVSQLLRMGRGAVVELETGLGDEIEMRINDQLVARGEVVVVEDRIAIEVTDIVKRESS